MSISVETKAGCGWRTSLFDGVMYDLICRSTGGNRQDRNQAHVDRHLYTRDLTWSYTCPWATTGAISRSCKPKWNMCLGCVPSQLNLILRGPHTRSQAIQYLYVSSTLAHVPSDVGRPTLSNLYINRHVVCSSFQSKLCWINLTFL